MDEPCRSDVRRYHDETGMPPRAKGTRTPTLLDNAPVSTKRIVFWNAASSIASALSSFVLLLVATRLCGTDAAGDFSIGYAIAQLMWTVGVFEATTYFATDAANRFSSEQYLGFKICTCTLMAMVSVIYVASFHYGIDKSALALWLCLFRLVDAFGMYYFAAFQKAERLDISGFSLTWQMIISTIVFGLVAAVTRDLISAVVASTAVETAWVLGYNIPRLQRVAPVTHPNLEPRIMGKLFVELLPLFIATFLSNYLANIPKYAIDAVGTSEMQTIFNVIFMPSFVINLFLVFFIRPLLTKLAVLWVSCDFKSFLSIMGKLMLAVVGISVVVLVGAYLLGIPILQLIFGVDLEGYLPALLIVLVGGGLLSAANVLYNGIVIMRRQRLVLIAYGIAVLVGVLIAQPLVVSLGIFGASLAYAISCGALLLTYVALFVWSMADVRKSSMRR